jgi:hypothetical protein
MAERQLLTSRVTLLCNGINGDEQLPFIRGRVIPETESTGRVKRTLDVLLWLSVPENRNTVALFDELEQLRAYLSYFQPPICSIRLLVPANDHKTVAAMRALEVGVRPVQQSEDITNIDKSVGAQLDKDLQVITATALACDADCVVTDVGKWLPYVKEFEELGVLLTSPDFLLRYAETFVRGHDCHGPLRTRSGLNLGLRFTRFRRTRSSRPVSDS